MQKNILLLFIAAVLFTACGPKISGKDEKTFKATKTQMEEKLNKEDKEKLEKALRVVVMKAMEEKWNHPEKYEGKSFNMISMEMIDGKTYSGIVAYAEDFLKDDRDEKIENAKAEIDSLNKEKLKASEILKKLEAFKLTKITITEDDFFDRKQPFLDLVFTNTSKENLMGEYMFNIEISSKSTSEKLAAQGQGGTFKDEYILKPNEIYEHHQPLLNEAIQHSSLWKTAKYPITDFAPYDLVIKAYATKITTKRDGTITRPKADLTPFDAEIKKLNAEIKTLKETKGTLSELELTNNE